MDRAKNAKNKYIYRDKDGFIIRLGRGIYCDRAILPVLRDATRGGVSVYLDEEEQEWVVWIGSTNIEEALSVAEGIFKYATDNNLLGR